MNRYIPVGKAQLKFFHRPLSSLVQRGRAERKTKEQEQEQGEKRGREREEERTEREGEKDSMRGERHTRTKEGRVCGEGGEGR